MTDPFSEELRKTISRVRMFEVSRRCGKSVSTQVSLDMRMLEEARRSAEENDHRALIAPPVPNIHQEMLDLLREYKNGDITPWRREYICDFRTEEEQNMEGKYVSKQDFMNIDQFINTRWFSGDIVEKIRYRQVDQWSPDISRYYNVSFQAFGGAYAFVLTRKSQRNLRYRLVGVSNSETEASDRELSVKVGGQEIRFCGTISTTSLSVIKLYRDYDFMGSSCVTDGNSTQMYTEKLADKAIEDTVACFEEASRLGYIKNLQINGVYCSGVKASEAIIKLQRDLDLF